MQMLYMKMHHSVCVCVCGNNSKMAFHLKCQGSAQLLLKQ